MKGFVRLFLNCIFLTAATVLPHLLHAQYPNGCPQPPATQQPGSFSVSAFQGCAPFTVRVTSTDPGVNVESYQFNYQGGPLAPGTNPSRDTTYTRPGRYVILQYGTRQGIRTLACQTVDVKATPPPRFRVTTCSARSLALRVEASPENLYDAYEITWEAGQTTTVVAGVTVTHGYPTSAGQSVPIRVRGRYRDVPCGGQADTVITLTAGVVAPPALTRLELTGPTAARLGFSAPEAGLYALHRRTTGGTYQKTDELSVSLPTTSASFSVPGLDNQARQYCFRVEKAGCAAPGVATPGVFSAELCSLPLAVATENGVNKLQWSAYPEPVPEQPFGSYTVQRNGGPIRSSDERNQTRFDDDSVTCHRPYTYRVVARIGAMESWSEPKTVTAQNALEPPRLANVYATVEAGGLVLHWLGARGTSATYQISRSGQNQPTRPLGDTTATRYRDASWPADGPYCYTVSYQDDCQNPAPPSEPVCPVWLSQRGNLLTWTPYEHFPEGLSGYTVEQLDDQGNALQAIDVGNEISFLPNFDNVPGQEVRYRMRARSASGGHSLSNVLVVRLALRLYVPEAFSPNGDGLNDTFRAVGMLWDSFRLMIYTRWGQVLFQSDNPETGWDGTVDGQPVAAGTYVYQIEASDSLGKGFRKRGLVAVIR